MKVLLQRVSKASVSVDGEIIGAIGHGLVVLVGVAAGDTETDARLMAAKTAELRIFSDADGKFNLSAKDTGGELLIVSQFTLLADTRKIGLRVATGRFQAHMLVEIANDGPVTIMLDSREKGRLRPEAEPSSTEA